MPKPSLIPPATSTKEQRYLDRLKDELYALFDVNYDRPLSFTQVQRSLGVRSREAKETYSKLLEILVEEKKILRHDDGSYQLDTSEKYRTGRIEHNNPRFAFLVADGFDEDAKIATADLNGAVDGDTVKAVIWQGSKRSGRRQEGQVVEILERKREQMVGLLEIYTSYAKVSTDNRRLYQDIIVPLSKLQEAQAGDKVVVKITHWPDDSTQNLKGEIAEVLGHAGENNTEMHAILAEYGLPNRFDEAIEAEAQAIAETISPEEIKKRKDFRKILTLTIDPADAKDFDDALSFQVLKNGNYEVGVHIADVTHYIRSETLLEKEAFRRGTSVYLVDRVVPMLPEKLSNNLCSLRPNEDKLTFSAVFELSPEAEIVKQWFGRTVIHSDKRFSYEEAQEILESRGQVTDGVEDSNGSQYNTPLLTLNALALKLREKRFEAGAVNFETVEVKFHLDDNGTPLGIYQKTRKDAHKLIEEFMLLANKKVAEFVYNQSKGELKNTMVYRIHEAPDVERLRMFSQFIKKFGYKLEVHNDLSGISAELNRLMHSVEGKPEQNVLESLAIRTMAKARYSTLEVGHYGLAFRHYTHFTSPIRRYPDMMAHRLLQHYLDKGESVERAKTEGQCKYSSEREKMAAEAERASIKYKQVEYMSLTDKGQVFEGVISGITEFGIFVEITETSAEGLVRMTDLNDDFYELDQANYRVVGKRKGRVFNFGDKVSVKVKECNLAKRSIDLALADGTTRPTNATDKSNRPRQGGAMPKGKARNRGAGGRRR